jgi:acetyl-CoA C-acetyltransferase
MEKPVILSAVRTPIGKFMGGLSPLSAPELGAKVVAESVRRAGIEPRRVDEVIMATSFRRALVRIRRGRRP